MRLRSKRVLPLFLAAAFAATIPFATPALGAPAAVTADLNPDTALAPGTATNFSFTIGPNSRTLTSFTLTPPAGYAVGSVDTPSEGTSAVQGGAVFVTGLSVGPSETATVTFSATTSCSAGNHAWAVAAKDGQGRTYAVGSGSDLTSTVGGNCHLGFVTQPNNTLAGDLITVGDRQVDPTKVAVELLNPGNARVTHFPVSVTFVLGSDPSGGDATLSVTPELTSSGVATFDTELEIDTANVAEFSAYTLVPRGATLTAITGAASNGFDIWESGTNCAGGSCGLNHDGDEYRVPAGQTGALLSASTFDVSESTIDCSVFGYQEITNDVVWHEYTGAAPVLVTVHITRAEMKASANNGQARVEVCAGLLDDPGGLSGQQKWAALGVEADAQDSDGDGIDDIWVALAPDCPNQDPSASAPCIDRQYGDGNGGSFTEVWMTGGDPPRRT